MKGNRIKLLREEKKIRQDELAKVLSISPSAVGMYERDEREPNDEITLKLAEYFGVSTDYLLGKSDIRNPEEFKYAYNRPKEADGLSDEEVNDALRLYKKMKKQFGGDNKNEIK